MVKKEKFPFYRQLDYRDCGPTCLRMVAKFHGKTFSREFLRDKATQKKYLSANGRIYYYEGQVIHLVAYDQ